MSDRKDRWDDERHHIHEAPSVWNHFVSISKIPADGLHVTFEATSEERAALIQLGGLRGLSRAAASFDLSHAAGESVHVTGSVTATVGQTCVVTLEPLDNEIDEAIDVMFVPPSRMPSAPPQAENDEGEIPDPPELIVSGAINLGKLAADILFLGIDPYPRKPDAVFKQEDEPSDPAAHPFAALKALKADQPSSGKGPKRR